jgi:hypothetical protein
MPQAITNERMQKLYPGAACTSSRSLAPCGAAYRYAGNQMLSSFFVSAKDMTRWK